MIVYNRGFEKEPQEYGVSSDDVQIISVLTRHSRRHKNVIYLVMLKRCAWVDETGRMTIYIVTTIYVWQHMS